MNRLAEQFQTLKKNNKKAFVPYMMAGDGGLDSLPDRLKLLETAGAAAIEVGIPFSDPVADGPVIQEAGIRALEKGTTLRGTLEKITEARKDISIPIVVMTYLNPILAYGTQNFVQHCTSAGVDGCIIPDLPVEEESIVKADFKEAGIELIRLVTLTTPMDRIKMIAEKGNGFVYAVTVKGTTGGRRSFQAELAEFLSNVKEVSPIPVLAGFGISNGEQARELASYCDGVIVGSKIVEYFHEGNLEEITKLVSCFQEEKAAKA